MPYFEKFSPFFSPLQTPFLQILTKHTKNKTQENCLNFDQELCDQIINKDYESDPRFGASFQYLKGTLWRLLINIQKLCLHLVFLTKAYP